MHVFDRIPFEIENENPHVSKEGLAQKGQENRNSVLLKREKAIREKRKEKEEEQKL